MIIIGLEVKAVCLTRLYIETWLNYRFYDVSVIRIVVSGKENFYEFDIVSETSIQYTGVSVFDKLLYEATVEAGLVTVPERNENETENDTGNHEIPHGTGCISSNETDNESSSSEEKTGPRKHGHIRQQLTMFTYD